MAFSDNLQYLRTRQNLKDQPFRKPAPHPFADMQESFAQIGLELRHTPTSVLVPRFLIVEVKGYFLDDIRTVHINDSPC